jgi:hypothetical protein
MTQSSSMSDPTQLPGIGTSHPGEISVVFGRSIVRLSLREWVVVALIIAVIFVVTPYLCNMVESSPAALDDRVPYAESEDYWNYRRRMDDIVSADRIPIIGDSVVWGDYVTANQTLSAFLNSTAPAPRFSNAGLNGAHPLALSGLVDYYAGDLCDRKVMLHCNLLWLSSPDRDLQSDNDVPINHTRLIPQFLPRVPSYKAPFAQRLGIVIDRAVPFFDGMTHLRTRYFEGRDLESWSLAHPYANPLSQFRKNTTADAEELRHKPIPWTEQGIGPQDMPWVDLRSSLQWQAWRQTLSTLRSRHNQVFVLVGPLNEHLLEDASRQRYETLKREVEAWLSEEKIAHLVPEPLPSDDYGDASHPLSGGYGRLAQIIAADATFREWLGKPPVSR